MERTQIFDKKLHSNFKKKTKKKATKFCEKCLTNSQSNILYKSTNTKQKTKTKQQQENTCKTKEYIQVKKNEKMFAYKTGKNKHQFNNCEFKSQFKIQIQKKQSLNKV